MSVSPCALRPLHLAFALDGPVRRARRGREAYDPEHYVRLARLAERGTLDFVTLGDSFPGRGPTRSPYWPGSRPGPGASAWCRPSPPPIPSRSTSLPR